MKKVIKLAEAWLFELVKGIGKLFLNPLLYWAVILVVLSGISRVKKERSNFGIKVFDVFAEWQNTWRISLVSGLVVSVVCLGLGVIFSYETVILLSLVSIVLSVALKFTYLSPSYTIGITFLLLLFIPLLTDEIPFIHGNDLFSAVNFTGLALLLGLLLLVEGIQVNHVNRNESFPELVMSKRGKWVGQHHLKKMSIIPFFVLIPSGAITPFASFWPTISIGADSYSLLLVPFLLGFDHIVKGHPPYQAKRKLATSIGMLGVLVLLLAVGSLVITWLSLTAVIIAILGREYIRYKHQVYDNKSNPYFHMEKNGLKVLGVIPGSPADQVGVLTGETIYKVNGQRVNQVADFYRALQTSGAYFKMDVIDDGGEIRFVQHAFYQHDHHELGILFAKEKYRLSERKRNKDSNVKQE